MIWNHNLLESTNIDVKKDALLQFDNEIKSIVLLSYNSTTQHLIFSPLSILFNIFKYVIYEQLAISNR